MLSGIKLKLNSLLDFNMIDRLYKVSEVGVKIKFIVRGICCLIFGKKGFSENIEVISIVDKFLEYLWLYIFENVGILKYYIFLVDFMIRNFDICVEIFCFIYDIDI